MTDFRFRCHYAYEFTSTTAERASNPWLKTKNEIDKLEDKIAGLKTQSAIDKNKEVLADLYDQLIMYEPEKDRIILSTTAKNRVYKTVREVKYGIIENLNNKYLQKGILVEDDSINLYSRVTGTFLTKNTKRYEDDVKTGEMDIVTSDKVIDIKSSWDMASFSNTNGLPKANYWQAQSYLDLLSPLGVEKAEIVYCLTNTPIELIKAELRNVLWQHKPVGMTMDEFMLADEVDGVNIQKIRTQYFRNGIYSDDGWIVEGDEWKYLDKGYWDYLVATELLDPNFEFKPVPEVERVKVFQFNKSQEDIDFLKRRMLFARSEVFRLLDQELSSHKIFNLTEADCSDKESKD